MDVSQDTQATLMLTTRLGKNEPLDVAPFTPREWNTFAAWLANNGSRPSDLLTSGINDILGECPNDIADCARIGSLLDRGMALGMALEKWQRVGIWVVSRADSGRYPKMLRSRLGKQSPSVLFGCGSTQLLNNRGIGVIGSRKAPMDDLEAARAYGCSIAIAGFNVVSGGARGVDEQAQHGSYDAGGTTVAFLSHGLLAASSKVANREHILEGNLLLLSATYPEAGFNVGTAMQRNKYIYCQSDAAIVVHSREEGGTWNGAIENLDNKWVTLWVHPSKDAAAANDSLVNLGALRLDKDLDSIDFADLGNATMEADDPKPQQTEIFAALDNDSGLGQHNTIPLQDEMKHPQDGGRIKCRNSGTTFLHLFEDKLQELCSEDPIGRTTLIEALQLRPKQFEDWIEQSIARGVVTKLSRPVRYKWNG